MHSSKNGKICAGQNVKEEVEHVKCVGVTLFPSWTPASPVKSFSAPGGGSQAALLWPGHETPRRGSHQPHSNPQDFGATLHFQQTRDWRPGGGAGKKIASHLITAYNVKIHKCSTRLLKVCRRLDC